MRSDRIKSKICDSISCDTLSDKLRNILLEDVLLDAACNP